MNSHLYQFEIFNEITKQMYKCQAYNETTNEPCQKQATQGFLGCSVTHGMQIKEAKGWIQDFRTGDLTLDDFYPGMGVKKWTVGEYLHYLAVA